MDRRNFFRSLVGAALAGSFVENFNNLTGDKILFDQVKEKQNELRPLFKFKTTMKYNEDGTDMEFVDLWSKYSDGKLYYFDNKGHFIETGRRVIIDFTDYQAPPYTYYLEKPPRWAKSFKWVKTQNLSIFKNFLNT